VRIIIVTYSFWQDLNISESNLSLYSDGNRGAAPLNYIKNLDVSQLQRYLREQRTITLRGKLVTTTHLIVIHTDKMAFITNSHRFH
jgi:hypothetical protein